MIDFTVSTDDFDLWANPLPPITPPLALSTPLTICHDCRRPSSSPLCAVCKHDETKVRGEE